ncbi:hypothetical protein AQUCO_00100770v1 [Aquilegia coerulea]|uniref:Uncharacterized protein n=1 Tax=Aquilegia coerulea TaxID=218851 RepID=A0A2G5FBY1_AQUCA|nr:hypothetical protein AQUCO_00100770v1 [Aquilegia coerulea]
MELAELKSLIGAIVGLPGLFLMKRGVEVCFGQLGQNSCHLIKYLKVIDGFLQIGGGYSPATWMLKVTSD